MNRGDGTGGGEGGKDGVAGSVSTPEWHGSKHVMQHARMPHPGGDPTLVATTADRSK